MLDKIEAAIEGILFAKGEAVSIKELSQAIQITESAAEEAGERLKAYLEEEQSGIRVLKLDDSFQMCTAKEVFEPLIKLVSRPPRHELTESVLETLAIIAYKQPVTKADISAVRGVSSDHAVNKLLEYGLIEENGRLRAPGRPMTFKTTEEFLRRFQIESADGLPLPGLDELEGFRTEAETEAGSDK